MKTAIEMAREVGMLIDDEGSSWGSIITTEPDELERFAALARADEREGCVDAINSLERQGAWITRQEAIEAIRLREGHEAS